MDWARAATSRERMIKMFNPHTGENIRAVFWAPEYGYIQPAMEEISRFFRDFRQNQIVTVDIDLLNILHYMQSNVGNNATIELHSGYRSPATNSMLARRSKKCRQAELSHESSSCRHFYSWLHLPPIARYGATLERWRHWYLSRLKFHSRRFRASSRLVLLITTSGR